MQTNTSYQVTSDTAQQRLDIFLKNIHPDISRNKIQTSIKNGEVTVNDIIVATPKYLVQLDQIIQYQPLLIDNTIEKWQAKDIELDIILEDEDICIINKPVNLTMHPGAGTNHDTLANALLARYPKNQVLPRAGIVHRLDKNTSGCCIVAKNLATYNALTEAIKDRKMTRTYLALVYGVIELPGSIKTNMDRHPKHRTLMAVTANGKPAITFYRPIINYPKHTLLEVELGTGRTHQIRVHLAHIKHPIVGDRQYAKQQVASGCYTDQARQLIASYPQQALHAIQLKLDHPINNKPTQGIAKPPAEFCKIIAGLQKNIESEKKHDWQQLFL